MKRWQYSAASAAFGLCVSGAAMAQTYSVYLCSFVIRGMGGEETTAVFAIDAAGKAFTYEDRPGRENPVRVPVEVQTAGGSSYIFYYSLNSQGDGKTARGTAQVRVPQGGGKASISISWRGHYGNPRGNGACELNENMRLPY